MVQLQIQDGACCALASVRSHWPGVDLMEAVRGPPRGRDEPMPEHYATATAPSALIVEKVLEETG